MSNDALLLKDLGYPYPVIKSIDSNGNLFGSITTGLGVVNQDILSEYKIKATSKAIFQPIFKQFKDICQSKDSYVISHSLEQGEGVGAIYIKDGEIRAIDEDEKYLLKPNESYEDLYGLLNMLGHRTSMVLIGFANEMQKRIEESNLPSDQKKEMLIEIQAAVTMEKLRMKHSKHELPDTSRE